MKIRIYITKKDIREGRRARSTYGPVKRAVTRRCQCLRIRVNQNGVSAAGSHAPLTPALAAWIVRYDHGRRVRPASFTPHFR